MEYRNFRVKSPVKSFRDLEVYQKTIQLSDEITNLPFLSKEYFQKDNEEIKQIAEKIPKLIAEAYGDKFDSKELAHKKLTESITLITNAITKIDLLRQRFAEDKENKFIIYSIDEDEIIKEIEQKTKLDKDKIKRAIKFKKKEPVKELIEEEIEEEKVTTVVQQVPQLGYITKVNGSVIIRLG